MPSTAILGLAIAILVERAHKDLIEFAGFRCGEVAADIGEVVVDAVALGDEVGAQHVVLPARRQHGVMARPAIEMVRRSLAHSPDQAGHCG